MTIHRPWYLLYDSAAQLDSAVDDRQWVRTTTGCSALFAEQKDREG
jgi:hypothetical protein